MAPSERFMRQIHQRARQLGFDSWVQEYDPEAVEEGWAHEYLGEWLEEQGVGIHDELDALTFWALDSDSMPVVKDFPVVLYHHTSTAAVPTIERSGIQPASRIGSKAMTQRQADENPHVVFVTSEARGMAPTTYQYRAVQRFGGNPATVEIVVPDIRYLSPDEDDADLRSGYVQFQLDYVPSEWIV